jgi:hypothetical protein
MRRPKIRDTQLLHSNLNETSKNNRDVNLGDLFVLLYEIKSSSQFHEQKEQGSHDKTPVEKVQ